MNKETLIQLYHSQPSPQLMIQVIFDYIFERTGQRISGNINIDPFMLMEVHEKYQFVLDYYSKRFHIHFLYDKNQNLLKVF